MIHRNNIIDYVLNLKPCPFCGETPKTKFRVSPSSGDFLLDFVCKCGAVMTVRLFDAADKADAPGMVINILKSYDKWNRRIDPTPILSDDALNSLLKRDNNNEGEE